MHATCSATTMRCHNHLPHHLARHHHERLDGVEARLLGLLDVAWHAWCGRRCAWSGEEGSDRWRTVGAAARFEKRRRQRATARQSDPTAAPPYFPLSSHLRRCQTPAAWRCRRTPPRPPPRPSCLGVDVGGCVNGRRERRRERMRARSEENDVGASATHPAAAAFPTPGLAVAHSMPATTAASTGAAAAAAIVALVLLGAGVGLAGWLLSSRKQQRRRMRVDVVGQRRFAAVAVLCQMSSLIMRAECM